jgi:hypothetical protein
MINKYKKGREKSVEVEHVRWWGVHKKLYLHTKIFYTRFCGFALGAVKQIKKEAANQSFYRRNELFFVCRLFIENILD